MESEDKAKIIISQLRSDRDRLLGVLDKIRTEIEALPKTYPFVNHYYMYVKENDVKKISTII